MRVICQKIIDKIRGRKKTKIDERMYRELLDSANSLPCYNIATLDKSESCWLLYLEKLKKEILHKDVSSFLSWRVMTATMVTEGSYVSTELEYLKSHKYWISKYCNAIREDILGSPKPFSIYPASSKNLIHHAYHIALFEEKTNTQVSDIDFVFEFGGGYGSMARLFQNLNYQGKYIIFDFPIFSALQLFFLRTLGFKVLSKENFLCENSGILLISNIDDLCEILKSIDKSKNNLFLATWSLSETPMDLRDKIKHCLEAFNLHLIAYQHTFREIDNVKYFDSYKDNFSNLKWENHEIPHLKGNSYLIGKRP